MATTISWHYVLKFIITGDAGVGKSSLLIRLTDQRFLANPDPTLGVEFGTKLINLEDEGKVVKLQCWDTAGTESFRSITRSYYRGAAGCLLVYDVTSRASFNNVRSWLSDVRAHADPHLSCILVGNKVDLCPPEPGTNATEGTSSEANPPRTSSAPLPPATSVNDSHNYNTMSRKSGMQGKRGISPSRPRTREVSAAEAEQYAKEEGLLFVEASAKSGENVERAFVEASKDILVKIKTGVFNDDRSPGVKSSKPTDPGLNLVSGSGGGGMCCSS